MLLLGKGMQPANLPKSGYFDSWYSDMKGDTYDKAMSDLYFEIFDEALKSYSFLNRPKS